MPGNLTLETLKSHVQDGSIDTILVCQVDMQGRLMGKRMHAQYFIDSGWEETHSCNYLQATDFEMEPVDGYKSTSWEGGYGDYTMIPDMSTLRLTPWLEGTALVLCDLVDHHSHEPVPHSPRAVLKKQIARLDALGISPMMATELEFYLFEQSFEEAYRNGYRNLTPISAYNEDYHIFQTTKEEAVMRAIRNGLYDAGIPVEGTKGEADAGQEEINIKYSDALDTADNHSLTKNACKEIAWAKGHALTFLAKWHTDMAGSSSHVHQSLWSTEGEPLFKDPNGPHGMSEMMQHYLAGLLAHASEITYFLAPNINSYKRFQAGTFAPTKAIWSRDNRTAGYRVVGEGTSAIRIECRVGGSDLNPYLAMAALIAAGLDGIETKMPLEAEFTGDAYHADDTVRTIPSTLRDAMAALDQSQMLRSAFGDDVIDHYLHASGWEQSQYDSNVTDWEVNRGFERG